MRTRIIVIATVIACFSVACGSSSDSTPTTDVELDESPTEQTGAETDMPTNPLEGIGPVELIASGFSFLEGPVYSSSDNTLLFSDIPADTILQLFADGSIEPFLEKQPTNGMAFDPQNRSVSYTHLTLPTIHSV